MSIKQQVLTEFRPDYYKGNRPPNCSISSLSTLFNRSLDSGSLPEECKLANIIPVFKKGDKSFVENYRPISLLCVVYRKSSSVACWTSCAITCYTTIKLVTTYGFTPGRSCTTQLVEVLNYIGSLLDFGKQTDVIFMDMSKAFDKVSHAALVYFIFYFILTALLNDVQTARVRTGLETHARHSPSWILFTSNIIIYSNIINW